MFEIDIDTGKLLGVRFLPSPHFNERPGGMAIDLLVIHGISLPPGQFGGRAVEDFFMGTLRSAVHPYFETIAHLKVSAHLFIDRLGSIIQFVSFKERAWHAGESIFEGRSNCNDFSIGIELEGTDEVPYEIIQYQKLAEVTIAIMKNYQEITPSRIVGHSDIAPNRKTDPGPYFDWDLFRSLVLKKC